MCEAHPRTADDAIAPHPGAQRLRRVLALFAQRRAAAQPPPSELTAMSAPAFRALVAQRLETLERDLAEVRSRINGLLFVVAGAVITQIVLRAFA